MLHLKKCQYFSALYMHLNRARMNMILTSSCTGREPPQQPDSPTNATLQCTITAPTTLQPHGAPIGERHSTLQPVFEHVFTALMAYFLQ
ncbi:unnamed protein product [Protopolystoma xenopodis]|uniref:Uncharacterized protein n=1 Tax=Protopolystoma xenopodis TaxID=117903 RepID=A0A448X3E7_9PLAT|nr:unnamed protein product [Protopolystoma xenopodis]